NITGFKDKRVDELCDLYDKEFDQRKRADIIREIDGIAANSYQYVLGWDMPFQRFAYWNKFGHPDGYISRIGDYTDILSFWWADPDRQRPLDAAMRDPSKKLDVGQTEVRYWQDFDKRQAPAAGTAK